MSELNEYTVGIDDLFQVEAESEEEALQKVRDDLKNCDNPGFALRVVDAVELD